MTTLILTAAPAEYDYTRFTAEIVPMGEGLTLHGAPARLVTVHDPEDAQYQADRYRSGFYATRTDELEIKV